MIIIKYPVLRLEEKKNREITCSIKMFMQMRMLYPRIYIMLNAVQFLYTRTPLLFFIQYYYAVLMGGRARFTDTYQLYIIFKSVIISVLCADALVAYNISYGSPVACSKLRALCVFDPTWHFGGGLATNRPGKTSRPRRNRGRALVFCGSPSPDRSRYRPRGRVAKEGRGLRKNGHFLGLIYEIDSRPYFCQPNRFPFKFRVLLISGQIGSGKLIVLKFQGVDMSPLAPPPLIWAPMLLMYHFYV